MARDVVIEDGFAKEAAGLRRSFEERFREPRSARAERFVWDYWHVAEQYTLLRTPAYHFFPERLYEAFHRRLVLFGRRTLGCHDVSPPWLSCYVDGCGQRLHGDLPHGQWAFVFSLTPWQGRGFSGGETLLLRGEVLDYWRDFRSQRGLEEPGLLRAVPPRFNRLLVFDPRIPHGVRTVRGTHDVVQGRLVIHGWFVQPRPFIEGPLETEELSEALAPVHEVVQAHLQTGIEPVGLLSLRLSVSVSGRVREVSVLSDTTRVPGEDEARRRSFVAAVRRAAGRLELPRHRGPSRVTLPLVFER